MVVTTIYLCRHGFRGTYTLDATTGIYSSTYRSPTALPADPPLVAYGVQQSHQLASALSTISPPIAHIYSSPYYRCLETILPTAQKLGLEIRADNGVGEWYGRAPFVQPAAAPPSVLHPLFPAVSRTYTPSCFPPSHGESIPQLHDRCAFTLSRSISNADRESGDEEIAIVICTHAAPLIAMGRVLTGKMPDEVEEDDFKTFTAGITKFKRRETGRDGDTGGKAFKNLADGDEVPYVDWLEQGGVMGGWDCVLNGDCRHLQGGEERGWHFTGDEAFSDTMQPEGAKL